MKKVSKLKRIMALVFGFLISFAPISSIVKATSNEVMTGQAFGNLILNRARESVTNEQWYRFRDNSAEWSQLALNIARENGLNPQLCRITFDDLTEYWVLALFEGDRLFVCDYCAVLREFDQYINNNNLADRRARGELNAENLPNLSREWYFMEIRDYEQAKEATEGKRIALQTLFQAQ